MFAPSVNLLLFLAVIALVLAFRSSAALAAAFGLAVTATMVLTTLMIGFVVFRIWRWNPVLSVPLYAVLLMLDVGLFAASATKFLDGGWLPVTIAAILVLLFTTWREGARLLRKRLGRRRNVGRSAPEVDGGRAAHSGDRGLSDLKPRRRAAGAPAQHEGQSCPARAHFACDGRNGTYAASGVGGASDRKKIWAEA